MKKLFAAILIAISLSGCAINDPSKHDVSCVGTFHLETSNRDYSVKLTKVRSSAATGEKSYYTTNPAFMNSWVPEGQFKVIQCK